MKKYNSVPQSIVLEVLFNACKPLSVNEIFAIVKQKCAMKIDTLYKHLKELKNMMPYIEQRTSLTANNIPIQTYIYNSPVKICKG